MSYSSPPAPEFSDNAQGALPLWLATPDTLERVLAQLPEPAAAYARASGFSAARGSALLLPDAAGELIGALGGIGGDDQANRHRFVVARIAAALPKGDWKFATDIPGTDADEAALGWLLAGYAFTRYAGSPPEPARLVAPDGVDAERIQAIAEGEWLTRDLINTPAEDMGPPELEAEARQLAERHGAEISVIEGPDLIDQNFPLIHTVGRAAQKAPRLIEMNWGTSGPRVTLVGKGVCFDTGGLNLKPGGSMGLMKKDMGGAATVLGLAHMIMATKTDLRLRVLIPAVENAVSGNAFRPSDILTARNGKTVEINNTDAEGRLVLADALALAAEGEQDLIVSMATLTGAARVAVGPDLAPFYCDDDGVAAALADAGQRVRDPLWRLPFWDPYEAMIEPGIADLDNAPSGGFAGSITAALFLRRFVGGQRYVHFDIYGWNPTPAPARPKGGVGQGARAIFESMPVILDR